MRPPPWMRTFVLFVVAAAALTGCGGDTLPSPGGGTAFGTTNPTGTGTQAAITIKNFKFDPTPLQVKVGQAVTVLNTDSAAHTATAADKSFDTGELAAGRTATFTPAKAGTIDYLCDIHQYMKARLIVS